MPLYHVTTSNGLRGMRKDGFIDPLRSKGKREYSWFVPLFKVDWAILNTQVRHAVPLSEVIVIQIDLDGYHFSEHAGSCKFFRKDRTPVTYFGRVFTAGEWIARNADEAAFQDWGPESIK